MARPGIDSVQSVQSQWIGPYTFAYKVSQSVSEGPPAPGRPRNRRCRC